MKLVEVTRGKFHRPRGLAVTERTVGHPELDPPAGGVGADSAGYP